MDELAATLDLARRFFDAIEAGDTETAAACYADDAAIWHNTDGQLQGKAANLETLKRFTGAVSDIRYTDRRVASFAGGFVQQHVLKARRGEREVELAAAIVCEVRDGRITRLDEYFDSAQLATWFA